MISIKAGNFRFGILIILWVFLFIGCDKEEVSTPNTDSETEFSVPTIIPDRDEHYLTLNSAYIFDQKALHTFELNLPDASLAKIDDDPSAEEYVEGMLIFEGDTISPVGVRYKGSIGAFINCLSGSDWSNPSGYKTCSKLSMKIKINWEGREDKFYDLKKLQFHAQNLDKSQMHERLGYWLFRAMGVPAPRSVHARLIINNSYAGLFALTEQIDVRFVKHNFVDDGGNLYKEVWLLNNDGEPHQKQVYSNALKTNEEVSPSVDIIKNFAQRIVDATSSDLQKVIAASMDINEIISYAVVDRMIRNDDGPFHWYCEKGSCSNHNYYWYEEPNTQKLHLIPWDLDNAFENIITNANPVTPINDTWGQITAECQPFGYGFLQIQQRSAACDKLIGGWASFNAGYEQLRTDFKSGPFSEEQVNALLESWSKQIRDATFEASQTHSDAISVMDWENAMEKLRNQLEFARNN